MIILSQNKSAIYNADKTPCIYTTHSASRGESTLFIQTGDNEENSDTLGVYDSPDRAKEVLRELYNDWINGIKWFEVPEV